MTMGVRKSVAHLSRYEQEEFVLALLNMKDAGVYDEFVEMHMTFATADTDTGVRIAHRAPSFLPWHRQLLLEFERACQRYRPGVTVPYWDWRVQRSTTESPWRQWFMGTNDLGPDGEVLRSPFAHNAGAWFIKNSTDSRPYLRRRLTSPQGLPTTADVSRVLSISTYDRAPWNSASTDSFRNAVEGWNGPANLHNRVHVWVGGNMATAASPNDPIFWLHHCYVDKLWADWQARHPQAGYLPTAGTPDVTDQLESLTPWSVAPADLLDHTRWYTYA
jgi:tyrosinase